MCTVCGCGGDSRDGIGASPGPDEGGRTQERLSRAAQEAKAEGEIRIEGQVKGGVCANHHHHEHFHEHPHEHPYGQAEAPVAHQHNDLHGDHHHYGQGPAGAHVPGMFQSRMVQVEQDILGKNNEFARGNRRYFQEQGILALNLVSSPGSGKTSLLSRSIKELLPQFSISVIEGDQQTSNDAERIRQTGVRAIQVNTGKGCHLDAHMVAHAVQSLKASPDSVLFIENVGNLVCPAAFDLGEAHKVVILSVTEGEDKPIKYPDMFYAADLMLLNKVDLLPHLDFDVQRCLDYARQVNPDLKVLSVSARSGEGLDAWYQWISDRRQTLSAGAQLPARSL